MQGRRRHSPVSHCVFTFVDIFLLFSQVTTNDDAKFRPIKRLQKYIDKMNLHRAFLVFIVWIPTTAHHHRIYGRGRQDPRPAIVDA